MEYEIWICKHCKEPVEYKRIQAGIGNFFCNKCGDLKDDSKKQIKVVPKEDMQEYLKQIEKLTTENELLYQKTKQFINEEREMRRKLQDMKINNEIAMQQNYQHEQEETPKPDFIEDDKKTMAEKIEERLNNLFSGSEKKDNKKVF